MGSAWAPWVTALLVNLIRLNFSITQDGDSPEDFVIQAKADCYFTNGTEKVQFVVRFIFNLEEYAHFDSDLGIFVALTELGRPDAEYWNSRPDILERSRASVDMLCRHNYNLGAPFTVGRKVQPEVTVYPEKTPFLHQHNLLLFRLLSRGHKDQELSMNILGKRYSVELQPSYLGYSSFWWGSSSMSGLGKVSRAVLPKPYSGPNQSFPEA